MIVGHIMAYVGSEFALIKHTRITKVPLSLSATYTAQARVLTHSRFTRSSSQQTFFQSSPKQAAEA